MEFLVLGPLIVIDDDGHEVRIASVEQRRLLSWLTLNAGSIVMANPLADQLGLSHGALRTSISRLRRAVGCDVLVTSPPGYLLRTRRVDSLQFEAVLDLAHGVDDHSTLAQYRSALGLWRGEAHAEFAHELWAMAGARRLEELRAGAIERMVELLVESGDLEEAVANLESHIVRYPFRDRPRYLLMRAFAEAGRRVDASRAFQEYRTFLAEEFETEPSRDIIVLERQIAQEAHPIAPAFWRSRATLHSAAR
jgi:DNA-binding SARP family transcriptional activator